MLVNTKTASSISSHIMQLRELAKTLSNIKTAHSELIEAQKKFNTVLQLTNNLIDSHKNSKIKEAFRKEVRELRAALEVSRVDLKTAASPTDKLEQEKIKSEISQLLEGLEQLVKRYETEENASLRAQFINRRKVINEKIDTLIEKKEFTKKVDKLNERVNNREKEIKQLKELKALSLSLQRSTSPKTGTASLDLPKAKIKLVELPETVLGEDYTKLELPPLETIGYIAGIMSSDTEGSEDEPTDLFNKKLAYKLSAELNMAIWFLERHHNVLEEKYSNNSEIVDASKLLVDELNTAYNAFNERLKEDDFNRSDLIMLKFNLLESVEHAKETYNTHRGSTLNQLFGNFLHIISNFISNLFSQAHRQECINKSAFFNNKNERTTRSGNALYQFKRDLTKAFDEASIYEMPTTSL